MAAESAIHRNKGNYVFYDSFAEQGYSLPIEYYCYKSVQSFRVTCLFTGQYNTKDNDTITDVIL